MPWPSLCLLIISSFLSSTVVRWPYFLRGSLDYGEDEGRLGAMMQVVKMRCKIFQSKLEKHHTTQARSTKRLWKVAWPAIHGSGAAPSHIPNFKIFCSTLRIIEPYAVHRVKCVLYFPLSYHRIFVYQGLPVFHTVSLLRETFVSSNWTLYFL